MLGGATPAACCRSQLIDLNFALLLSTFTFYQLKIVDIINRSENKGYKRMS